MSQHSFRKLTCEEFDVLLCDYVDGVLTGQDRISFEAHRQECAACGELAAEASEGQAFLASAPQVTPPPELITRIVYHAPQGRLRQELERETWWSRATDWLRPVLQPRFAMSMAMTILSFAMLEKCTGIHVQEIRAADLSPVALWSSLEDKAYRTWDRTVKSYENLRLVYEIESRLTEMNRQEESGATKADEKSSKPNSKPGQGEKRP